MSGIFGGFFSRCFGGVDLEHRNVTGEEASAFMSVDADFGRCMRFRHVNAQDAYGSLVYSNMTLPMETEEQIYQLCAEWGKIARELDAEDPTLTVELFGGMELQRRIDKFAATDPRYKRLAEIRYMLPGLLPDHIFPEIPTEF